MDVDLDITEDLDVSVEEANNNNLDAKEEEDNNIDVLCVQTFQNDIRLIFDFTLFEKWKWNWKTSRSRSRGEIWKKFSRILEKRDSRRLLVQSGKDHLISVVIAKFLYYFPQSIHLSFWFWYMCHWDISFPIFCDIIRPIFEHLPSHFLDAAASLASTG